MHGLMSLGILKNKNWAKLNPSIYVYENRSLRRSWLTFGAAVVV
jgi:hypothetical protein